MGTRRNLSAEFKAQVALEALVGDKTLAELAAKHGVHPNMITQWKRQAEGNLPGPLARKSSRGAADREAEIQAFHARIGQLTTEATPAWCLPTWRVLVALPAPLHP
jgi:transposase